jgi:drug/metabolite transporter (DMT)-like permease
MRPVHAFQLVLLAAIWGGSFACMRVAAPEFGVVALIALRLVIATAVLMPLLTRARWAAIRKNWKPLALLAAVNSAIPFCLLAYATSQLSAGLPSIINATVPFFATLIAWAWIGDKPKALQWLGLVIGFGGVVVLTLPKLQAGLAGSLIAVASGLLGAGLYGFSAIYTKKVLKGVEPMVLALGGTGIAMLYVLPVGLAFLPERVPSVKAFIAAGIVGAICTGFAYVLFYRLFAAIGATKTVTVTFLIPVFGVLWGATLLGEKLTWNIAGGGAWVLVGMGFITQVLSSERAGGAWGRISSGFRKEESGT